MPKLTEITKDTDMNTFLKIADYENLSNSIRNIRMSLTEVKENLEIGLEGGKGFDLDSFVIEGEAIIHNELFKQTKNLEMLIQDLQYEEWRIFERGKWHRTRELENYIDKLTTEIQNQEKKAPPFVPKALDRPFYTSDEEYNNAVTARNTYESEYNTWEIVYKDLETKLEKAETWLRTTQSQEFASLKYVQNLNNVKGGVL